MNRALLIIICDFILLSLLAVARFEFSEEDAAQQAKEAVPDFPGKEEDLVAVLEFALEAERESRQALEGELDEARREAEEQARLAAQREQEIQAAEQQLVDRQRQTQRLEQEQQALRREYAATRETMDALRRQLESRSSEAEMTKERLQVMQEELQAKQQEAQLLEQRLTSVQEEKQSVETQKQALSTQLQVSEAEKRLINQQVENLQGEVQTVRQEKVQIQQQAEKLSDNVSELAGKSEELRQEIQDHRPLPSNVILTELIANRVHGRFTAERSGFLGRMVTKEGEAKTILVDDGYDVYALFHVDQTPLSLSEAGADWERLVGYVRRGLTTVPISEMTFLSQDPRIVAAPVSQQEVARLGASVYKLAADPLRFPDAVVVNMADGSYGEARFTLDPDAPRYLRMDRSLANRVTGKFNPGRGDLVMSRSGELIGVMVNENYASAISNLLPYRSISLGQSIENQRTGQILNQMRAWVDLMPPKLR